MKIALQTARFLSAVERPGTGPKSDRQVEYSYYMEVRAQNARRMLRETHVIGCFGTSHSVQYWAPKLAEIWYRPHQLAGQSGFI